MTVSSASGTGTRRAPSPDVGTDSAPTLRRPTLYALLIAVSAAILVARIVRLDSSDPKSPTPFLSANDRSRWATIRALGDDGTYLIDHVIFNERGNRVRGWHTIDLVKHRGPDGQEHYYSSKPTLLTTLLAGEYWLLKQATGASLADQPHYVSRLMLILANVLPLVAALACLARIIDRYATTDFARFFAVAAACFGTFMTTFAVTLNNHLTAAIGLVFALTLSLPIFEGRSRAWWRFAAAGLAYAFVAANELPALSILVFAALLHFLKAPLPTLTGFVPAAVLVAAAAFGTNYVAHGDWRTPYAHRKNGPVIATLADRLAVPLNDGLAPPELLASLREQNITISDKAQILQHTLGDRWRLWDAPTRTELSLERTPEGAKSEILVRRWDNWYDYEGSYWTTKNLRGIDRGEPSPLVYAFNVLLGHHGLLSLTPLWILSAAGCILWLRNNPVQSPLSCSPTAHHSPLPTHRILAITTILITLTVLAFYLTRPQIDRNYGGGTCCLRWFIWLTPLWLLTLLPTADWFATCRYGRKIAIAFLAVSVFSVFYALDNPWSHPWIFDYWTSLGWINYR